MLVLFLISEISFAAAEFRICAIPHNPENIQSLQYVRVEKFFSEHLGIPVKFVPASNYIDALKMFTEGDVHLCWLGGLTGVLAANRAPKSIVIAQGFEDQYFKSYMIARRDSGINSSEALPHNLNQLSLLFGPRLSTSGHLMPLYFISDVLDTIPKDSLKHTRHSNSHKETIELVKKGEYDLGFVNYRVWLDQLQKGRVSDKEMFVVWETPSYADYHWLLHNDAQKVLGENAQAIVSKMVFAMNSNRDVLKVFNRSHFVKAESNDYEKITAIALELNIINHSVTD